RRPSGRSGGQESDGCTISARRVWHRRSIWAGVEKRETRGAQNAVPARACGFKSRPRYQRLVPPFLDNEASRPVPWSLRGAVAQLGEHKAGSLGVRGSNPLSSTRSSRGVAEYPQPRRHFLHAAPHRTGGFQGKKRQIARNLAGIEYAKHCIMPGRIRTIDRHYVRLDDTMLRRVDDLARMAGVSASEVLNFVLSEVFETGALGSELVEDPPEERAEAPVRRPAARFRRPADVIPIRRRHRKAFPETRI